LLSPLEHASTAALARSKIGVRCVRIGLVS
jgi:hypothetical protein